MNIFDEICVFDEAGLDLDFQRRYSDVLKPEVRGFGYWCWKPQIVRQVLESISEGDVLVYADAGCHLNRHGSLRMHQYFQFLTAENPILAFQNGPPNYGIQYDGRTIPDWPNEDWTKEDLFFHLGIPLESDIRKAQTFHATAFLLKKGATAGAFMSEWISTFEKDWNLIDDSPSTRPCAASFKEHRHDQSIFSILCERYPVVRISSSEIVYPRRNGKGADWRSLAAFPIQGRRDLYGGIVWWLRKKVTRLARSLRRRYPFK